MLQSGAGGAQDAAPACGDVLAWPGRKPAHLVCQGCQQNRQRQDQPFEVRCQVEDQHALQADAYLRRAHGLPKLQRYCCMWDSTPHSWRDRRTGYGYVLLMATGETPVRTRAAWPRIGHVVVRADGYAQGP
ncbi:DUF4952 domain-containing protein [Janthinobacterium sp. SUN118]|uniref:DUF4952 domain-containing protein n=1 Tax=Janthinobacterium sp. SUN118 TaxID=3004100 RepID=UPI0025B270A6|nr:DUF4952 domain-containing protein [Janthinobacterium sp. SUN118]MDN2709262.1 DUF4952 domain-containing protein [Janthinobacterium sp. SUN118]